jgi:hypothetical protein
MLYYFFWVIPRRLNVMYRRLGTRNLFDLHMGCKQEELLANTFVHRQIQLFVLCLIHLVWVTSSSLPCFVNLLEQPKVLFYF